MTKQKTNLIAICGGMRCGKDSIGEMIQFLTSDNTGDLKFENRHVHFYSTDWQIKKFADKLKETVALLIGCTRQQLEDEDFKNRVLGEEWWYFEHTVFESGETKLYPYNPPEKNLANLVKPTPRMMLQRLGTELMRTQLHPNVWINSRMATFNENSNWIMTDCRFDNEAKAIREKGGILIKIRRPFSLRFPDLAEYGLEYDYDHDRLCNDNPGMCAKLTHSSETGLDNWEEFDYIIDNDGDMDDLLGKVDEILIKEGIKNA